MKIMCQLLCRMLRWNDKRVSVCLWQLQQRHSQQKGPMNYSHCGFVSPTQYGIYYLVIKRTIQAKKKHMNIHTLCWKWLCKQIIAETGCRFIVKCRSVCALCCCYVKWKNVQFTWNWSYWYDRHTHTQRNFYSKQNFATLSNLCAHLSLAFRRFSFFIVHFPVLPFHSITFA